MKTEIYYKPTQPRNQMEVCAVYHVPSDLLQQKLMEGKFRRKKIVLFRFGRDIETKVFGLIGKRIAVTQLRY